MKYIIKPIMVFYITLILLTWLVNEYLFNSQIENTLVFFQTAFTALMIYFLRVSLVSFYKSQQSAMNFLHPKKEYQRMNFENLIRKRPRLLAYTLIPFMENKLTTYWCDNMITSNEWSSIDTRDEIRHEDAIPFIFQAMVNTKFCLMMATNSLIYLIAGFVCKFF